MTTLDAWVAHVCAELGVPAEVDVASLLGITRDVAHQVERAAAPLTAYLCGLAVGRGVSADDAAASVTRAIESWPSADRPTD